MKSKKRKAIAKSKQSKKTAEYKAGGKGKSKYALKHTRQARGVFSSNSPFKCIETEVS